LAGKITPDRGHAGDDSGEAEPDLEKLHRAFDFLMKPILTESLLLAVDRAFEIRALEIEKREHRRVHSGQAMS
jgi:DNA-binding NtrC family response regulator